MVSDRIRDGIRAYLRESVMYRRTKPLADDDSLVKSKLLDSLAMLSLIAFLEEAFEIDVSDDEVEPEVFDSINSLTDYVLRKKSSQDQAA